MRSGTIIRWWQCVAQSSWHLLVASALVALAWPLFSAARADTLQMQLAAAGNGQPQGGSTGVGIGALPASFTGDLPGAGGPVAWQVDLFAEGRYQLRTTYLGKPEPNHFDGIGRWAQDGSGRIVLRGGHEAPIFLLPMEGGAALRKLDLHGNPIESLHNDRLIRLPESSPIEPRLVINGMFTYMADAANITLCADGQRLPVTMEGDYGALEAAYLKSKSGPGQPLLASLEGLITQRPAMEESHPPQTTLVVERFIAVWPHDSCGNVLP